MGAPADPDREFDAIVVGEYERAFYGGQYASMAPLFEHYGIQLWTPEAGGRIDLQAEGHEQMMLALGLQSKREITRTRIRSAPRWPPRPASRAVTSVVGHHTVPAGRRGPAPQQGAWARGRRAHRLEPDPMTAPVVRWMFAQRLAGHSLARIARALNDAGIPCRPAAQPAPERAGVDAEHRSGDRGEPAVHRSAGVESAAHRP